MLSDGICISKTSLWFYIIYSQSTIGNAQQLPLGCMSYTVSSYVYHTTSYNKEKVVDFIVLVDWEYEKYNHKEFVWLHILSHDIFVDIITTP